MEGSFSGTRRWETRAEGRPEASVHVEYICVVHSHAESDEVAGKGRVIKHFSKVFFLDSNG